MAYGVVEDDLSCRQRTYVRTLLKAGKLAALNVDEAPVFTRSHLLVIWLFPRLGPSRALNN